jgi:hypothetical protein
MNILQFMHQVFQTLFELAASDMRQQGIFFQNALNTSYNE